MREAFAIIAAILLLLSTGCVNVNQPERPINGTWSTTETPTGFQVYENKDKGFSIEYPPMWEIANIPTGEVAVLSPLDNETDDFRENINILYNLQQSNTIRLDQLYDAEITDLKKTFPTAQIITSEKIMFRSTAAYRITVIISSEGRTYKDQILIMLNGSREYLLVYTATTEGYEQHRETAEQIMGSFKMT